MKKLIFVLFAALAAVNAWATANVTWSLGGAFDNEPASGVWVETSEGGGEQITSGHLYLCFTPAGTDSQLENWIAQLTSLSSNSGLDGAGVDAMTAFLAANSQWNGYNDNNPNFSANVYKGTGGAFGTPINPSWDAPSPVTIDGIDQDKAYDVVAIIFDTRDITADSKYVVINGYCARDFYMDSDKGLLEIGFYSDWYDDIDKGMAAPNVSVDGQWHAVDAEQGCGDTGHSMPETFTDGIKKCANCRHEEYDQPKKDTDNKTYLIANTGNLLWFRDFVNTKTGDNYPNLSACAKLTANIVVNDGEFDEDGNFTATGASEASTPRRWSPIGPNYYSGLYTGTFDGDGHTISGLYCKDSNEGDFGLFRYCGNGATVKGVGIVICYFNCGSGSIGAICSENYGTIDGCYSSGTITSVNNSNAGICLHNYGTISNSYSTCSVSAPDAVGGICLNNRGTLKNCYFAGELSNATNKGGICYINQVSNGSAGTVTNCYTTFDTAILDNNTASGTKVYLVETKTAVAFSKGEIAYKLNGSVDASGTWTAGTGTPVWYQKLGDDGDDYPVLKKASDGSNTIYYGYKNCTEQGYANTALAATPAHDYQVVKDVNGKATWTWANDYSTATLHVACTHNAEHNNNQETTDITSAVTTQPTAEATGVRTYTAKATYEAVEYTGTATEVIPVLKTISGTVKIDGNPAEGIYVVASSKTNDVEYYATTNAQGEYSMNVCQDEYTVSLNIRGYEGSTPIDGDFNSSCDFNLTRHKVHVSIGEHQYTTFYDGVYDMIIPEGFRAWTAMVQGEEIIYSELSDYIPAGTGVLLYCGDITDTDILSATDEVENNVTDNVFFGYDEDSTPTSSVFKYYKLQYSEEENRVGFYWDATDGAPFLCKAHKAYIAVSDVSPAEKYTELPMDDEHPTAIGHTPTISNREGAVYNLSGQKVSPNYKGIVIKNGKKVIQ